MRNIVVIADDITGAVEIAGVAKRYGLTVTLLTLPSIPNDLNITPSSEVTVIATNTRSLSEYEAVTVIGRICSSLKDPDVVLFKKTDSALRGHITAELRRMLMLTPCDTALLLAQNPSRGRVVKNGRYLIDGIPLHLTPFAEDPEFPASSDNVEDILGHDVQRLGLYDAMPTDDGQVPMADCQVLVADAVTTEEVRWQMKKATPDTLVAGAADAFAVFLEETMQLPSPSDNLPQSTLSYRGGGIIIFCGSTQSTSLADNPFVKSIGLTEHTLPNDVFNEQTVSQWSDKVVRQYRASHAVAVTVGQRPNGGVVMAERLKGIMSTVASTLVAVHTPSVIVIEGGATAFDILRHLAWQQFRVQQEYAPGIVSMTHADTEIILKPGSYPWGKLFNVQ